MYVFSRIPPGSSLVILYNRESFSGSYRGLSPSPYIFAWFNRGVCLRACPHSPIVLVLQPCGRMAPRKTLPAYIPHTHTHTYNNTGANATGRESNIDAAAAYANLESALEILAKVRFVRFPNFLSVEKYKYNRRFDIDTNSHPQVTQIIARRHVSLFILRRHRSSLPPSFPAHVHKHAPTRVHVFMPKRVCPSGSPHPCTHTHTRTNAGASGAPGGLR